MSCIRVAAGQGTEGFQPLALTFVSPVEGWVLGTSATIPDPCVLLYHTTDGGATWSQVSAPPAAYPAEGCGQTPPISCVDRVLFATPQRGFAFGADGGDVYETTNGGQVWSRQDVTGVSAMALVAGVALRLRATDGGCTSGSCQLERSTDGGETWSSAGEPMLTTEGPNSDVLLQGDGYAYAVGFGNPAGGGLETADLYSSSDFGVSWTHESDPCTAIPSSDGGLTITEAAGAAPGGVLAVVCLVDRGQGGELLMVSANGGASFGPLHPVPTFSQALAERLSNAPTMVILDGGQVPIPADSLFAIGSATMLAVVTPAGLSVSHDGGLTWSATYQCPVDNYGHGGISFVGFETASTVHLICNDAVARSMDGGLTWATYTFPS
jgi:photosystem II stability/assembly factor-like uncharacterized protein